MTKHPLRAIPLQVNDYMTQNWFKSIFYSLGYTNKEYTVYKDPFHEVGKMMHTCNDNMDRYFFSWMDHMSQCVYVIFFQKLQLSIVYVYASEALDIQENISQYLLWFVRYII